MTMPATPQRFAGDVGEQSAPVQGGRPGTPTASVRPPVVSAGFAVVVLITLACVGIFWSAPRFLGGGTEAATATAVAQFIARQWWIVFVILPVYLAYRNRRLFVERIEREQAQVRQASDVQLATIEALALAIEAKDRTSQMQIRKMQFYAAGLGRAVGMPENEIWGLQTAALLHDVGNLAVPEHILSKPGSLTYEEFQKVKTHPRVGAEILKHVPFPYPVASLILAHHEHWDGNGYPSGLRGVDVPMGARILAVVDSYTALITDRPHRPAWPYHEVIAALRRTAGTILDPALVETFVNILPVLEFQFANEGQGRRPLSIATPAAEASQAAGGVLEDIAIAHHEARVLYQIAQALGSSLGISETMTLIARSLGDLVPWSCCALFLRKDDNGPFECRWASGVGEKQVREVKVDGVGELETTLAAVQGGEEGQRLQSMLVGPLVFNDAVIGALGIYHTAAHFYSPDHKRVFKRVAEQAAPVIRNSIVFERTQEDSFTDHLTGLPNRRYMLLYLNQQMARAERRRSKLAVVMMDLNNFKKINDDLGHQAGDRALHEVASVLRSMVRAYDLCVRYGGDEFMVILWECDGVQAERRRRELESAVAAMYFEGQPGDLRALSVSAGVAVYPEDGQTHQDLIAVADRRMYEHKAGQKRQAAEIATGL
jgi:diguanylate cyclase (GGDEF)-like protein